MKKFYLFFAAALMALVSCSDDPETPVRVPEIVVNTLLSADNLNY